jgi:hypothetical protein
VPYTPTEWKNRVYDGENILQEGTPLSADNLNKVEQQLKAVTEEADKVPGHEERITTVEKDLEPLTRIPQQLNDYQKTSEKGQPGGYVPVDQSGFIPVQFIPSSYKEFKIVANIAERDALDKFESLRVLVMDASGDSTVSKGWAEYAWDGTIFHKTAEMESLDVVIKWANVTEKPATFPPTQHQHTEAEITDLDKYSQEEVNTLLSGKSNTGHKHTEADITDLDKYTKEEVDTKLAGKSDAGHTHSQLHEHANKLTLDKLTEGLLTQIGLNAQDIETLKLLSQQIHSHANKTTLDKLSYSGSKQTIDLIAIEEQASRKYKYSEIIETPSIPSKTSQLTNDSNYVKSNAVNITVAPAGSPPTNPRPNDIWIVI